MEALSQNRFAEVLEQALLVAGPSRWRRAYIEGLAHAALGGHEKALRCFETAPIDCLTPLCWIGGNACRALGNIEEGLRLYCEALQVHPYFSECRHNLALALIEAGQPQDAERELRLLLRDQPGYFQAAFCLANLLRDHKRDPEAIEAFRLCLQHAPAYADAWNNLGLAQSSDGDIEAAMASYRQALSLDASFKPSRQNLAQALIQKKCHDEALVEFERFGQIADLSVIEQWWGFRGESPA